MEIFNPDEINYNQKTESSDDFGVEESLESKEQRLQELLSNSELNVPKMRIENKDWEWINRNLGINTKNRQHPSFKEISKLLKEVLGEEAIDELLDL